MQKDDRRRLVLVVEDQDFVRAIMTEGLTDAGFDVIEAENGDLAILLLRGAEIFDAVVTDIDMPGSADGNIVGREAKWVRAETAVLYVTGRPDRFTNCLGAREALMSKPYNLEAVVKTVRKLLT